MKHDDSSSSGVAIDGDFHKILIRILNRATAIEQEPIDIGHGSHLHASEVHPIELAARYPDEELSTLAQRLGITRRAVFHGTRRLVARKYLERTGSTGNR